MLKARGRANLAQESLATKRGAEVRM